MSTDVFDRRVFFAAILGAIAWNIYWLLRARSGSSLALIGGLVGASMAKAGMGGVTWFGAIITFGGTVLSTITALLLAFAVFFTVSFFVKKDLPYAVDDTFRTFQFISASLYSLGQGGNDAQKAMGIIAALLYSQGHLGSEFYVPFWVALSCCAATGLGTLVIGWRTVRIVGSKISPLTPVQGFGAYTGAAITLSVATGLGIPVSSTQALTGSVIGVGAARGVSTMRWKMTPLLTSIYVIPGSALVAAAFYWASELFS
jgi:PiT family inorganic phosphate transporter